jgi:Erv1 / Alr family
MHLSIHNPLNEVPTTLPSEVWGPCYWRVFHTAADWYAQQSKKLRNFNGAMVWLFNHITRLLPCEMCAMHAHSHLSMVIDEITRRIDDPIAPALYMNDLHNHANEVTGKPNYPLIINPKPGITDQWLDAFWMFIATQIMTLYDNYEKIQVTVDLLDGVMPFLVPDHRAALMLSQFSARHSHSIYRTMHMVADRNMAVGLRYLDELRNVLLAIARLPR